MGHLEQKETNPFHTKKLRRNRAQALVGNEALVGELKTFVFFDFLWVFNQTSETRDKIKDIGKIHEMLIESRFKIIHLLIFDFGKSVTLN